MIYGFGPPSGDLIGPGLIETRIIEALDDLVPAVLSQIPDFGLEAGSKHRHEAHGINPPLETASDRSLWGRPE